MSKIIELLDRYTHTHTRTYIRTNMHVHNTDTHIRTYTHTHVHLNTQIRKVRQLILIQLSHTNAHNYIHKIVAIMCRVTVWSVTTMLTHSLPAI